jgi:hypothetical protein
MGQDDRSLELPVEVSIGKLGTVQCRPPAARVATVLFRIGAQPGTPAAAVDNGSDVLVAASVVGFVAHFFHWPLRRKKCLCLWGNLSGAFEMVYAQGKKS